MKFMGFSKRNLPVRFAALALAGAFVASLGVVALPSEAEAGRRRNVWSAKFKCSTQSDDQIDLDDDYLTSDNFFIETRVNILNPTDGTVKFKKKAVLAVMQHQVEDDSRNPKDFVSNQESETLGPNESLAVDCEDIRNLFSDSGIDDSNLEEEDLIEGWVVIESETGKRIPDLFVCANYIMAAIPDYDFTSDDEVEPSGASVQVVCYDPIRVRFRFKF